MTRSASSGTRRNERIRCAIYARKSSEEGIEQEFNSLQAQRQACEAFINSQCHQGWVCLRAGYDDGGFSGATMDRDQPLSDAVQAQLADNAVERHSGARNRRPSVLAGMLFDGDGNHMTPSHAVKKSTRYRSYVSRPLIAKDQAQGFAGLRIPAGEIEQLVMSRLRQWLFDSGSIYKTTGFPIPQHSAGSSREPPRSGRLGRVARSAPARPSFNALIERVDVGANQIDMRLRSRRLSALLDIAATPVRLSYLAPDITQAILDGRQPRDLTAEKLLEHSRLPLAWHDQRTALGFA